jgi:hypothetical protein
MNINLELIDAKLHTLAKLDFSLPFQKNCFMDLIILVKRYFFNNLYHKYKSFGSTTYSCHKFHTFEIISHNGVSVHDLSAKIPEGECKIDVRAKSIEKNSIYANEQNAFKAKFKGLKESSDILFLKKSINNKNKNNKLKKLRNKFGKNFTFDKFYHNKCIKKGKK